jgi:hypothetical protein
VHPIDLSAFFKVLDDLHFDGLLSRNGWRIRSGCLHSGRRAVPIREGEIDAYTFHARVWGLTIRSSKIIVLDDRLLNEAPAVRVVLLHEMLHARVMTLSAAPQRCDPHGRRFVQELRRLVDRGEECLKPEICYYTQRMAGKRKATAAVRIK